MRAKEYLEINKSKILYYDIVKRAIDDLSLVRNKKRKTEKYFNRYLFADARYIAQKEGFVLREGEVDVIHALEVRFNIMNAVCCDDSYIFAYNIIVMQKNEFHELIHLNLCNIKDINCDTIFKIEEICSLYKEDYPKQHICDFLMDDINMEYADRNNCLVKGSFDRWNDVFNKAYKHFDNIRIQMVNGFDEHSFIDSICTGDKEKDYEIVQLVSYLFSSYNYDLDEIQEKKYRFLSDSLITIYNEKYTSSNIVAAEPGDIIYGSEELERYASEFERLKRENEELKDLVEKHTNVMTCSQQAMTFIYLLNHMGINTNNTRKSIITRFVHRITGRSEDNIRKRLEFDYDDVNVKQNLRIVAEIFSEILPSTSDQILKDIEG